MARKPAVSNLDAMSLKELVALEAEVETAILAARAKSKADVKRKLAELAAEHGFSVDELVGGRKGKPVGAAKYANPDDRSDTWTGRGRKPNWLVTRLKKGAKLDDFSL